MKNVNPKYTLASIKFYEVLLILSTFIIFAIIYATYTSKPISIEILNEIRSNRHSSQHILHKDRMQIQFMEERGWYFIILGSIVVSVIGWTILSISNQRKKKTNFLGYSYRFKENYIQIKSKALTFKERLLSKFHNLTSNDVLIAEMLLDGLSTKQIASELNISPSSANTARYRLRKKLNLSSETDLITFLRKI